MHAPDAGDDAVRGKVTRRRGVGQQPVLDEILGAVVAQQGDALSAEQLARGGVGLVVLGGAALSGFLGKSFKLVGP